MTKNDPNQKRIHLDAGPDAFSSQMAYYETQIRQDINFTWKRFWHVINARFACAFDRFDGTVERILVNFWRIFGLFLTQMGPKVGFANGAI